MIDTKQTVIRSLPPTAPSGPKPAVTASPETSAPQESVQLSAAPAMEAPAPPKLKEPSGEMALMIDAMEAAEERAKIVGNDIQQGVLQDLWANRGSGGTAIAMLDDGAVPSTEYNKNIDGFLAFMVGGEVKGSGYEEKPAAATPHGKHPKENNGLLGGHLGIEGGEHVAHEVMAAKTEALGHAGHAAVTAKSEVLGQAGHTVAHSSGDMLDAGISQGHNVTHTAAQKAAEHGTEAAGHAMSGFMAGLTGALSAGSGVLGAVMLHVGIKGIKHGIKDKNAEHTIEGVNSTIVGTRSLAAGASMAGHLVHGSEVITTIAGVAKSALTPLGVVHGAIDAGLGAKQVYDGIKSKDSGKITKGSLGIGLGASLIGAAVGGGIPAIVAAGVFLTGKIVHGLRERKAHAHEQEQAQLQASSPQTGNDPHQL